MFPFVDYYGRTIDRIEEEHTFAYTAEYQGEIGWVLRKPKDMDVNEVLRIINAHIPTGWTPPEE